MMMGLSSMGCGGGGVNSSTSNLSASAPPFTVDRLNSKPNSSPMMQYPDSQYGAEPFSHTSQYPHIYAPRAEAAIGASEMISVPATDDYQFPASASFNSGYGGDVEPYFSPYVPSLVGEDSFLAKDEGSLDSRYRVAPTRGLAVTSQHDYTQSLLDLEYGSRRVDGLGFDDGKRAKRSEVDGIFSSEKIFLGASHGYENQLYRGSHGSEYMKEFKEDSGVLYKKLNQVSDREIYIGSSSTGFMEDKPCLDQQIGFFHYDSSKTHLTASSPPYQESYPPVMTSALEKNFSNYQNSCSTYEKNIRPIEMPFSSRASVIRSSPTVVIRPPPASSWNSGQSNASNYTNLSKPKDSGSRANFKPREESFESCPFGPSMQGNAPASSTSIKELSRPLLPNSTSDCKVKATIGSRVPDVNNGSSCFPMTVDNIQVVNSSEESSDFMDHHSTVDSPCWKGATSSQFSMFDIESGNYDHTKMSLAEHYGFGLREHQSLHSTVDSNRVFLEKVECNIGNENECGRNGVTGLENTLDTNCSTTEQSLLDGITDRVWTPPSTRSKGVELSGCPNTMMMNEPNLMSNLTSVFDMKVSDMKHLYAEGCNVNDVSEGAAVAVHAAEKVLASPASQDDVTGHTMVQSPRLDVQSLVKSMHNLSELLRFHISSDLCSLGEENVSTLELVMSNLNTCLSKIDVQAPATNKSEAKDLSGGSSELHGESCSAGIISSGPHTKCEALNSCTSPNHLHLHKGERHFSVPGNKDEISPMVSLLRDDLHISGDDDDMAKAIKKVLEQNFEIDEDMQSQALLFKSLWLEAEAKLCSMSYKARFERMKAQMERIKLQAPRVDGDIETMKPELCISPDPIIMSAPNIEASVLARFNILKSREENPNPINTEEEKHQSEIVDSKHADSVTARYNILKSREENLSPINAEEQHQNEIVDGEHADSVAAIYNILKSREQNPSPINAEEQHQNEIVDGQLADSLMTRINILRSREENPKLISVNEGELNSYFESEPQIEYGGSVTNNPSIQLLKSGSSSSEWEHVLKEDFIWKN